MKNLHPPGTANLSAKIMAAAALAVFVWLAQGVASGRAYTFDVTLTLAAHRTSSPALIRWMGVITYAGDPRVLRLLALVLIVVCIMRWPAIARSIALMAIVITVAPQGLKTLFHRAPMVGAHVAAPQFPSAHALASACFYGTLAVLVALEVEGRALAALIYTAAAAVVLAVGASRVYLAKHYPSEVIAGIAVGAVWTAAVALSAAPSHVRPASRSKASGR